MSGSRTFRRLAALRAKYAGDEPPPPARLGIRTRAGVLALLFLVPAAALYSSRISALYDADSLLPSLISLQKLTLFYWGQNRFGNLLPFLTGWIHDINLNFQAQTWLRALGTASIPLFVFEFIGLRKHYLAAYGMALALMFLPFRDMGNYAIWGEAEPYGHGTLILLLAFLLHRRNDCRLTAPDLLRCFCSLSLVCLALFVNGALILFAFPLWLAYAILYPHRRHWWFIAFLLTGYFVSSLLSAFYGQDYHPAFNYSKLAFQFSNFAAFGSRFLSLASVSLFAVYFAVAVWGFLALQRRRTSTTAPVLAPQTLKSLLIAAAAMLYLLVVINMEWTSHNDFAFRYFWFALVFIPPVCAVAVAEGIPASLPVFVPALASATLLAIAACCKLGPFEMPASFVEQTKRADAIALACIAREHHVEFVGGDYYIVWPAVFETIRKGQAEGDPRALDIHGLVAKGECQRDEIAHILRSSRHLIALNIEPLAVDFYPHALIFNATDWPPYCAIITAGSLPSGRKYSILAFDRDPPMPGTPLMPSLTRIMLRLLDLQPEVARWSNGRIAIAATGTAGGAWRGPFVNLTAGRYIAGYRIIAQADPSTPLCQLTVRDGYRSNVYVSKTYRAADLDARDGGTWASVEFTVPENKPTDGVEFDLNTSGKAPFVVDGMELRRKE